MAQKVEHGFVLTDTEFIHIAQAYRKKPTGNTTKRSEAETAARLTLPFEFALRNNSVQANLKRIVYSIEVSKTKHDRWLLVPKSKPQTEYSEKDADSKSVHTWLKTHGVDKSPSDLWHKISVGDSNVEDIVDY